MVRSKMKNRRRTLSAPAPDPSTPVEGFVPGKTCLNCRTTYLYTPMPEFQDAGTKHGQYNTSRQLPDTARDYPNCASCLEYAWRAEGQRFGMGE